MLNIFRSRVELPMSAALIADPVQREALLRKKAERLWAITVAMAIEEMEPRT